MKNTKSSSVPFIWVVVIILIIGGVWYTRSYAPAVSEPVDTEQKPPVDEKVEKVAKMITVTSPTANSSIKSPLTITGQARGNWYFEASFPIELQKSDGTIIVQTFAQAQGNWMTEDFVPFTVSLTYPAQPAGSTGKLILRKDNPSGLPENDLALVIPVNF